jgi:hypothetical protein
MAEIHIQKKRSSFWPWLIGIIVIIIIAWVLFDDYIKTDITDEEGLAIDTTEENYGKYDTSYSYAMVAEYIDFVNNDTTNLPNEEFIKEGVQKLSGALSAVAYEKFSNDPQINKKADEVRQQSDSLAENNKDSKEIKKILGSAADALDLMLKKNDQDVNEKISEIKNSAEKIDSNSPLTKQQPEIIAFFNNAGDVLQSLTGTITANKDDKERKY